MARKRKSGKKRLTKSNVLKAYGLDKKGVKPGDVSTFTYGTGIGPYYVMVLEKKTKAGRKGDAIVGTYKSNVDAKVNPRKKRKK